MKKNYLKIKRYYFRMKYEVSLRISYLLRILRYIKILPEPGPSPQPKKIRVTYIVFSKDRAAQLDLLLTSMEFNLDLVPEIIVIVKATSSDFRVAYERVYSKHSKVIGKIFEEGAELSFRDCFFHAYALSANSQFIGFLVDDAIFYRATSIVPIFRFSESRVVFCPRLGMNINRNYVQDIEQPTPDISIVEGSGDDRLLTWTLDTSGGDWARPFALDGNIYKKDIIDSLIHLIWFKSPNTLECELQNFNYMGKSLFPLAYFKSSCFLLPLNRVQNDFINPAMNFTPERINQEFLDGTQINIEQFSGITPNSSTFEYTPLELQ